MKTLWNPDLFKLGIDSIDEQHIRLFDALSRLHDAYGKPDEKERIAETIEFIGEYVKKHFKDEEEYMEQHGCADLNEHKLEHKKLLEQYDEFMRLYQENGPTKKLLLLIYDDLYKWLVDHISSTDKKIKTT